MPVQIKTLGDFSNEEIVDAVRNNSSTMYQQRVPQATKAGIKATMAVLEENRPLWNEFAPALLNQLGRILARNHSWQNELAAFKTGMLTGGSTIEEYQFDLLKAKSYADTENYGADVIFGREKPIVHSSFHTINRKEFYKTSVNTPQLRRALLGDDINSFVGQQIATLSTSDDFDEYLAMVSLLHEYETNGGFRHVRIPEMDISDATSMADSSRIIMAKARAIFDTWRVPSNKWNAARITSWEDNPEKMVMLCTPEFKAGLDVFALAAAFNIDRMDINKRFITIPEEHFMLDKVDAIMTTEDFFVVADSVLETQTEPNVASLDMNYFLHHFEVMSASRFVPAVALGREEDAITITKPSVTSVSKPVVTSLITNTDVTEVKRGEPYKVYAKVNIQGGGKDLGGVVYVMEGNQSDRTIVNQDGFIHVDIAEKSQSLKVTAISVADSDKDNSVTLPVTGELVDLWPNPWNPVKTPEAVPEG